MKAILSLLILLFSLSFPTTTFAQSDYVLPYPAVMPGSKLYLLQELKNSTLQYWYFGDFGQFDYNLRQSDKFLVEAKILFEYKQYLLAYAALQKSNKYFEKVSPNLVNAAKEGKDISEKEKILTEAALKHAEVLQSLQEDLPETFLWQPEKKSATELNLKKEIEKSIEIRRKASSGQNGSLAFQSNKH
jgi:hypothetical protein